MAEQVRAVRLGFLYLASLFGLVVLTWGLIIGGIGGVHYARPDLGRERLNQDLQARRFQSTLQDLIRAGLEGSSASGLESLFPTAAEQKVDERAEIKDEALSDTFKGGGAFVVGLLVLIVGTVRARRVLAAGRENEVEVSWLQPAPSRPAPAPAPSRPSGPPIVPPTTPTPPLSSSPGSPRSPYEPPTPTESG